MKRELVRQEGTKKIEKVGKCYVVSKAPGENYGITNNRTQAEIWFDEI